MHNAQFPKAISRIASSKLSDQKLSIKRISIHLLALTFTITRLKSTESCLYKKRCTQVLPALSLTKFIRITIRTLFYAKLVCMLEHTLTRLLINLPLSFTYVNSLMKSFSSFSAMYILTNGKGPPRNFRTHLIVKYTSLVLYQYLVYMLLQVILFEIDCAIFYTILHELFCQFIS